MTDEKIRMAETVLKDGKNHPALSDIIKDLGLGGLQPSTDTFPPERICKLRQLN
jgi:hypothetical protein